MRLYSSLLATVSAGVLVAAAGTASAGSFALKERSARAQGLSFAGATSGSGGLSSMGFNPAALGLVRFEVGAIDAAHGVSFISPISDGTISTGGTVDADRPGAVAMGYIGYRLEEDILIGLSLTTPFGLATQYPAGWVGAGDGITSKLLTLQISPTFAYQPSENLTFAVAINLLYADARLTSSQLVLDGDDKDIGFAAGVMWEPLDGTTLGLAYQHGYNLQLQGTAQGPGTGNAVVPVSAAAELPATVSLGITQDITDSFRLMGEFQWQNWSRFNKIDVTIAGAINQSDPQNYDDAFFVALGGEYDFTPALTVRAGAAWDQTPTNSDVVPGTPPALGITNRTVRVPDEDRIWLSIGASYDVSEHMTIDAGYSYLFAIDDPVVGLRSAPGTSVTYDGGAHIFSLGGSIQF